MHILRSNLVIKTCRGRPDHRSCFPPSGCPARQHEPALRYRQSDLLRFYMTSETFQLRCDHVRQHGRSQSCCIGVYEEKERLIAEQSGAEFDERMDRFFNLPDLALRPTAVRWRIHDDRVIAVAAAQLTFDKFRTVIDKPADRSIIESGSLPHFLLPSRPCPWKHPHG